MTAEETTKAIQETYNARQNSTGEKDSSTLDFDGESDEVGWGLPMTPNRKIPAAMMEDLISRMPDEHKQTLREALTPIADPDLPWEPPASPKQQG
jgi:hypothetical protein